MPRNGQRAARLAPSAPASANDVLLGYLCGNEVTQSFHRSILDLIGYDLSHGRRLNSWAAMRSGPLQLVDGRNQLAEQTLKSGAEWLFMVDSDMGFEPDTLERLLAAADPRARPVVGGLCFAMREYGGDGMGGMNTFPSPTIMNWVRHDDGVSRFTGQDHYPVNTMIRCGATGAACLLIHRSALEAVGPGWFERTATADGKLQGEDVSFCAKLAAHEIPLWIHTGIRTTHFKHVWLAETDFWHSRLAPFATETVDVVVPALHRPQNVPTLMRSLRASTGLATAWWVCDPDDAEQIAAVEAEGGRVLLEAGTFAHKVNHAYEHGMGYAPWLLLVGDDVRFRPGWLDQALEVAGRWKADVVGTNDLQNRRVLRGEHATHMLIRRSYVEARGASWDGPGIVCHEGYHHQYVDDEIVLAAKMRGAFQAAIGSHVEHRHPLGGTADVDDVYALGQKHAEADGTLFKRRMSAAFAAPNAVAPTIRVEQPVGA